MEKVRNLDVRNHGLRSRDIASALKNALIERGQSYKSVATNASHLRDFSQNLKDQGIKDLRKLERTHVQNYAENLRISVERGEISPSTAQNRLSAVNVSLEQARQNKDLHVSGVRDANLQSRTHVAAHDKSLPLESHRAICDAVSDRLSAQMNLQRELGLRFKESCLLNARAALAEAQKNGSVTISDGTKGGRSRSVPISQPGQIAALERGASIQGMERSLVPATQRFSEYQRAAYEEISKHGISFHSERHAFANDRFSILTGLDSPVRFDTASYLSWEGYACKTLQISSEELKLMVDSARLQLSEELGHGRIQVTSAYLGSFS